MYIYIYGDNIYMYIYINTAHTESMRHARQVDKIQKNVGIPNRIREQFYV